jgi:hypothetical protein
MNMTLSTWQGVTVKASLPEIELSGLASLLSVTIG